MSISDLDRREVADDVRVYRNKSSALAKDESIASVFTRQEGHHRVKE